MSEPTLKCPKCAYEIKLTEAMAAPMVETMRLDYEQRLAQKDADAAKRDAKLREREEALRKEKEAIDDVVNEKMRVERTRIIAEADKKARLALGDDLDKKAREMAELQEVLKGREAKLAEAQKAEVDFKRKARELDDARREMALDIEKQVAAAIGPEREKARKEAADATQLQIMERDQRMASMQKTIDELKRKAEQGSQQLQGEVQELELESLLADKFPHDTIEPVGKGVHGGDVVQRIVSASGQTCGSILWESKRTRNWSDGWLAKLRDDQRAARSEIAVIVTQALPKDVTTFDAIDGVWVTSRQCAIPVAIALRQSLLELAKARQAGEGQQSKMGLVYEYLMGPRFRHRVEAMIEKSSEMKADLDKEKRAITKAWAKREEQIDGVLEATAGLYGDLQGIAGKSLKEIEGLDLKLLEGTNALE